MRRHLTFLIAALVASALALFAPASAEATPYTAFSAPSGIEAALLQPAGYYGGYHNKKSYDDYEPEEYDDGDDEGYHKHKPKRHHEHKHQGCGGGYKQKYVCEQAEPRCFKQRECVWYYGREYYRYVRKCHGGEKYCKWISVPSYGSCY